MQSGVRLRNWGMYTMKLHRIYLSISSFFLGVLHQLLTRFQIKRTECLPRHILAVVFVELNINPAHSGSLVVNAAQFGYIIVMDATAIPSV